MAKSQALRARLLGALGALLVGGAAHALPWDLDMWDQPSVKPQERPVEAPPEGAVPRNAGVRLPVAADAVDMVNARQRAGRELQNPSPPDATSLGRGSEIYRTNCAVCHGSEGHGDGPVGEKYTPKPVDLTTDYVQSQADGQIFYTITRGSVAMPEYAEAVTQEDRWHLINYIKHVLGQGQ